MADTTHVRGLSELNKFLDEFSAKHAANIVRGGLRAGAVKELLPEAQANLLHNGSVRTGELIAGLKVGTRTRGGTITAYVKVTGKHAFVAPWLEFGTAAHVIAAKKGGYLFLGYGVFATVVQHPGSKKLAFMRPALDRSGAAAVVAAAEYMRNRLATKEGLTSAADIVIEADEP